MGAVDVNLIEPDQEIEIDLMRPQDAPGVSALFRAVYGDDYPVRTYYDPEALLEANRTGAILSVVTRTIKGDIVGHNAVYRIAPCPKIYEAGAGLVLPAYRNTAKLFGRMVTVGIKATPPFGGEGIYGEYVCNHVFTQKMAAGVGSVTMGIEVDLMPAAAYTKEGSSEGRVSSLFGFQTLTPHPHKVYLPPIYEEFLRFAYKGVDDRRDLEPSLQTPPEGSATRITAEIFDYANVTRIAVREIGEDLVAALDAHEQEAAARGVVVFQVWLPLAAPWVGWAVDALRQRGYFLGGLLPRWFDGDGLMVQRLVHPPDWEAMQIYSERSQAITGMVKDDWEKVIQRKS